MAWEVYGEGGGQFNNLKDARQCAKEFSLEGNDLDGYGEPGEVNIWKDGTLFMTYDKGKLVYDGWTIKRYTYMVKNLSTMEEEEIVVNKKLKTDRVYSLSDGRRVQPIKEISTVSKDNAPTVEDSGLDTATLNTKNKGGEQEDMSESSKEDTFKKYMLTEDFQTHSELNPKLFNNITYKLKEDVRDRLIKVADMFVESMQEDNVPVKVYDYWLLGSNAAYNYNKDSDIDVHIIVDISETKVNPYIMRLLYDYVKSNFNDKYDIMIKGHEVELYLEDINTTAVSSGIYSLKKDSWIKIPKKEEVKKYEVENTPLYNEIYKRFSELDSSQAEEFLDDLYILRKESLASEGEFGLGNLIFKEFRNKGYIDELKDMKYRFKSQELTLENYNFNNCDGERY